VFLSHEELSELSGVTTRPAQIAWLEERRIPYVTCRGGRPKVLRAYIERRLGLCDDIQKGTETQPDFTHLTEKS
jgi:hypothetical protein